MLLGWIMLVYNRKQYKKEKKEACKFWKISKQKGFSGSQRVIDTFCK